MSLGYVNQGSRESEQRIDWPLNVLLVRRERDSVYIWFLEFRKEVEKLEGFEKRC